MKRNGERTIEWQEWMLARMVEPTFVKKTEGVKGAYTTGDFVTFLLNDIFGPSNWSHRILKGPELIQYGEQMAYSQVTVQLAVRFADGREAVHEDIGIWPFVATKAREGGTLDETKPERFEQVVKSAVTDGLKACTDHLGNCFRPIADKELEGFLRRRQGAEDLEEKGKSAAGESAEKGRNDLFGEEPELKKAPAPEVEVGVPTPEPKADGVLDKPDHPRTMVELYKMAQEHGIAKEDAIQIMTASLNGKTIRDAKQEGWTVGDFWKLLVGDGSIIEESAG